MAPNRMMFGGGRLTGIWGLTFPLIMIPGQMIPRFLKFLGTPPVQMSPFRLPQATILIQQIGKPFPTGTLQLVRMVDMLDIALLSMARV